MTTALEKAFDEAAKLPSRQQRQVASYLLEEVERVRLTAALEVAESDIVEGRVHTVDELREMVSEWNTKSSSRGRRSKT